MLSKEEIEKIKKGLTEELGRTITANECGLSTNDFSESIEILEGALNYIAKLETDKQKLIEKLENKIIHFEENEEFISSNNDNYSDGTEIYRFITEFKEILEILKGEKE